jgi:hypothetical protein
MSTSKHSNTSGHVGKNRLLKHFLVSLLVPVLLLVCIVQLC